jgi:hypothetical protein
LPLSFGQPQRWKRKEFPRLLSFTSSDGFISGIVNPSSVAAGSRGMIGI